MDGIQKVIDDPSQGELASAIADGLSFSIAEAPEYGQIFERADRLPLSRARREAGRDPRDTPGAKVQPPSSNTIFRRLSAARRSRGRSRRARSSPSVCVASACSLRLQRTMRKDTHA